MLCLGKYLGREAKEKRKMQVENPNNVVINNNTNINIQTSKDRQEVEEEM